MGIGDAPGAVDVIDAASLTNVKSVPVKGGIHNVYVTPDGKHAVAGSIPGKTINVIDTASNQLAWTLTLSAGIRPMAFTQNPDGSTKEIVVQLSEFHGFALVDFATQRKSGESRFPIPPDRRRRPRGSRGPLRTGWRSRRTERPVGHEQILGTCRLLAAGLQAAQGGAGRNPPGVADDSSRTARTYT